MNNQINDERMGKCVRCGVEDELYHGEICDSCVLDSDFERWEAE